MFFDLSHEYFIFTDVIKHVDMEKTQTKRAGIFFQKILEDKRAIRACVQSNGNLTKLAKERDIKFATPVSYSSTR